MIPACAAPDFVRRWLTETANDRSTIQSKGSSCGGPSRGQPAAPETGTRLRIRGPGCPPDPAVLRSITSERAVWALVRGFHSRPLFRRHCPTRSGRLGSAVWSCAQCLTPYSDAVDGCFIDGSPVEEHGRDPLIGRVVDRFRITGVLGDGAQARVYRAEHQNLDRAYALKILFGDVAADEGLAARFRLEANVMSQLDHPNIVAVADFGVTTSGMTFLAMELLSGETLRGKLEREGRLSPERAAKIARQIAAGLAEAHARRFVHRDLKPSNIMIETSAEGTDQVKILDFGLARAVGPASRGNSLTRVGLFLGTPMYASPEQIMGERVTSRSDLYALGVILFEMLEGRPPFDGASAMEIRRSHVLEIAPRARPAHGLESLVEELLSKQPAARPASARAVIDRIDQRMSKLDSGRVRPPPRGPAPVRAKTTPSKQLDWIERQRSRYLADRLANPLASFPNASVRSSAQKSNRPNPRYLQVVLGVVGVLLAVTAVAIVLRVKALLGPPIVIPPNPRPCLELVNRFAGPRPTLDSGETAAFCARW
jgi:serine/threonine protein kinase